MRIATAIPKKYVRKVAKNAHTNVQFNTVTNVLPKPAVPKEKMFLKLSNPTHVNRFVGD
jgi:hypothetical protein